MKKFLVIEDNGQDIEKILRDNGISATEIANNVNDINEAKQQSEQKYLDLLKNAPVGVFYSTLDGKFINANPAVARILKYDSVEEFIRIVNQTSIAEAVYVDPGQRQEILERIQSNQGWQIFERQFRCKDNSIITCTFHICKIKGDDGQAELTGFIEDITERKQFEEALKKSENSFRLIVETAMEGIWQVDRDWKITYVNKSMEHILGYESNAILGLHINNFIDATKQQTLKEIMARREQGIREVYDFSFVCKDKSIINVIVSATPQQDENGCFAGAIAMLTDITDRKRAEESLKLNQFIIDKASIGISRGNDDGQITFANEHWAKILGYTPQELCSMTFFDIDPNLTPELWRNHRKKLIANGSNTLESLHRRKDGTLFPVEIAVNYLSYKDHEFSCSFSRDITERKMADEQLKQKQQQLEALNSTLENRVQEEVEKNREKDLILIQQNRQAALGELLDHIAHQWKQPLNSIALIIQDLGLAVSYGELTERYAEEAVGKTMALLEHTVQTIDIFRGFYRPDKEKKIFTIKESIDQALTFIAPAFRFNAITIELDVDPGLTAFGYHKEYTQVILNILNNARDIFKARKAERPRIVIKAFEEDNKAVVTITDNGGGIPEKILDKIFEIYFTTNESNGGTGIGLYMSKNIIENNMNGRLIAKNKASGAQFRIEL